MSDGTKSFPLLHENASVILLLAVSLDKGGTPAVFSGHVTYGKNDLLARHAWAGKTVSELSPSWETMAWASLHAVVLYLGKSLAGTSGNFAQGLLQEILLPGVGGVGGYSLFSCSFREQPLDHWVGPPWCCPAGAVFPSLCPEGSWAGWPLQV